MAKLKFDRIVNIKLKVGEKGTVPDDEVWKGTLTYTSQLKINDNTMESYFSPSSGGKYGVNPILSNIILGGVQSFLLKVLEQAVLQGLHLRLSTNILAKEVSLA